MDLQQILLPIDKDMNVICHFTRTPQDLHPGPIPSRDDCGVTPPAPQFVNGAVLIELHVHTYWPRLCSLSNHIPSL